MEPLGKTEQPLWANKQNNQQTKEVVPIVEVRMCSEEERRKYVDVVDFERRIKTLVELAAAEMSATPREQPS